MRVLWFTNIVMPEFARRMGLSPSVKGGWIYSLADALDRTGKVQLGIAACIEGGVLRREEIGGTVHYGVPLRRAGEQESVPEPETIGACKRIVAEFRPDLIHIHGTEQFFGLLSARGYIRVPTVISIQGLVHVCERHYFGGLSLSDLLRAHSLSDLVYRSGLVHRKREWKKRGLLEHEIIAGNKAFIGRTMWDRAHVRAINPDAAYYHCDELMRPTFYTTEWDLERCRRFTIFTPTGEYPLKGLHWVLRATAILRREFPNLRIRIADGAFAGGLSDKSLTARMKMSGYSLFLARLVEEPELREVIEVTGQLDAEQMTRELSMAHVFVSPSMVENSSNALCEAALIGTPSVVSLAGGSTSLIDDRRTAIGFPPGDEAMLAEAVRMIFTDDTLAASLSREARQAAHVRHAEARITNRMLEIYQTLCPG